MKLRPPLEWLVPVNGAVLLAGFIGLAMVLGTEGEWSPMLIGAALVAAAAWLAMRASQCSIVVGAKHVQLRGVLRTIEVPIDDIEVIECAVVDDRAGFPIWAPRFATVGGQEIVVRRHAGYSAGSDRPNRRVAREVDAIRRAVHGSG